MLAIGTHDGRVEKGDFPETQAILSTAPLLPSKITLEQQQPLMFQETGTLGAQDTDLTEQCRQIEEAAGGSSFRLKRIYVE